VKCRPGAGPDVPGGARAEFPARTSPKYGRAPLTDKQKELATRHMPLARILARRLRSTRQFDRDEIESVAFVALVEAAGAYEGSAGAQFPTFARYRIEGAILDYFRKTSRHRRGLPAATSDSRDAGTDLELLSKTHPWVSPELPVGAAIDGADSIEAHFRRMPAAQARACRLIYLEGKSQDEVAEIMDCTKSYVSQVHREALDFLAECFRDRRGPRTVGHASPVKSERDRARDFRRCVKSIRSRSGTPKLHLLATAC
jgi:RNA polymerase sigma factor (sigma-70 family)